MGDEDNSGQLPSRSFRSFLNSSSTSVLSRLEVGSSRMQQFGRDIESPSDGHHLLNSYRIRRELALKVQMEIEPGKSGSGTLGNCTPTDSAKPGRLAAKANVLSDRQVRDQIYLLIHGPMPSASASRGDFGAMILPPSRVSPASRGKTPVKTLISVLFPAPFSPISACISPACTVTSTASSALTPGNPLLRAVISKSGVATSRNNYKIRALVHSVRAPALKLQ